MICNRLMVQWPALLFCLLLFVTNGCVENSIVVKVRRDGSALLHVRSFMMPSPFGKNVKAPDRPIGVHKDHVDALIRHLGPGFSVQSNQDVTSARGWPGTELILRCEDVNALKMSTETFHLLFGLLINPPSQKTIFDEEPEKADSPVRLDFDLKSDQLTIHIKLEDQPLDPVNGNRAQDPFGGNGLNANVEINSIQTIGLREARFAFFVETEREIVASDSTYPVISQSLVKLYELDGPNLDLNKHMDFIRSSPKTLDDFRHWVEKVDGFSVETKSKVEITLR